MIVVRSPLIIFQGLYIGFDFFRFVEDGQIAVYAGEGRDGEVLFVYNGKLHLSNLASKKYGTTYTERNHQRCDVASDMALIKLLRFLN